MMAAQNVERDIVLAQPAELADVLQFLPHVDPVPVALHDRESQLHGEALSRAMNHAGVIAILGGLVLANDLRTYQHSAGVAELAAATTIRRMTLEDYPDDEIARAAEITAMAGAVHDGGKVNPLIQHAIHSSETFSQNPQLRQWVELHPEEGMILAIQKGLSTNVAAIVGAHHTKQPLRGSYGVPMLRSLPEADDYLPPIELLDDVIAADHYHALAVDFENRNYRLGMPGSPEEARLAVNGLAVIDGSKRSVIGVADLSGKTAA